MATGYPENRNPAVRLASRRAYRERNRKKINERQREKRHAEAVVVKDKTELVLSYAEMTRSQLEDELKRTWNPVKRRVINRFIRDFEC